MSGTPNKRVHDDSGGHPSLSRYTHMTQDDSGAYSGMGPANSKLPNPSAPSEYHAPSFDMGQDSRMPKVPRTEMREMESRRSPMLPMYRTQPSSVNEPQSDHVVNPEESNVRDLKVENRDGKAESRELYQGVKYDKDFRYTHDYKGEYKHEPSAMYPVNNSRSLNWNESKDHHRTWKYPDTSGGNMDSRDVSRSNIGDNVTKEDKDHNVPHETASENKVNDDRLKERDRKRKDVKHREWGENNKETKEPSKEERETDRKELPKEKDKVRDKNEKEGLQNDKEDMDVSSSRVVEQKSSENWKELDKEPKDRKMERDGDNEGEKRNKGFDKDSDDGGVDVEGSADRERDGFNYGVQQRKRMLRPRGSPQVGNRDPRFRSRPQDNDGSTGKDVSTVVYRVGECVQELLKLWKEYESAASDKIPESSNGGPTLEIRIPAEHVCATNRQVKGGQLWGTDVYTDDSDLVAVLMHTGFCRPTASPPPPAIQELRATVRVLPPQNCYISTLRNNVRSRAWGAAIGCSFRVERCHIVKKGGGTIDLEPCLTHTSTVEPTLAPVVVERTMTTRAAASNALRQQRFVREVTLQYNLCNEPWIKYSISAIADKGLKKPLFTSARLKKGEVLYLESRTRRFELCFNGEKVVKAGNEAETHLGNGERSMDIDNNNSNNVTDVFRWSQCKKPLPQTLMLSIGIPLPLEHLEVLEENLDWEDIQWSQTGVWISGKEYPLSRVHFLSR